MNALRGQEFRVVEFSVQATHIHLIVEAEGRGAPRIGLCTGQFQEHPTLEGRRGELTDPSLVVK
ncbi:MAG TPA: hypothetical protein VFQ61_34795 [Polyangiaceae bacterium]|nr:hypothetical protein [Polyangiaceae bacterium]